MTTRKVRCECGKVLFLVRENVLEIRCPRSGHTTTIALSPTFHPPAERRPRCAAGSAGGNVEPRERRERQEGQVSKEAEDGLAESR